ncbi:MAG TPA: peptidylprolyl isomerase [Xanthomonadales bacterium]|nr:peptidylprolyl isomerase [Xanthomonadales bacterium]
MFHKVLIAAVSSLILASGPLVAQEELLWREVEPENMVVMELQTGTVIIELNPAFAPKTVEQFRALVRDRFFDGLGFYRVIDGFVAQGGDGSDLGELSDKPTIDAEFERKWDEDELTWQPAQEPDLFAPRAGFVDGFPAGRGPEGKSVWLTHCPGAVAMARNNDKNSSRSDFYIVIGQAPRYLDRNMNIFGRVIDGMNVVQQIERGPGNNNGIFRDETKITRIRSMRMASDIPEEDRISAYVVDTNSLGFLESLESRRERKQPFFHHEPPQVLDVCQVPLGSRITK